jgi:hypothetical protein
MTGMDRALREIIPDFTPGFERSGALVESVQERMSTYYEVHRMHESGSSRRGFFCHRRSSVDA